ncbi:MAG: glycosyltransferase, partial [Candidatus Eisenbacteria sp.]|nr:glycosyltransferase [Candidatus Eisenbacteria bacterium]
MAVRRGVLAELGPMDEEFFLYNEDVEWCRRAHRKGLAVGLVTDALFDHEGGASTRTWEGPPFAARVLADFHYFCEGEGVSPGRIRRLWRVRLIARSWLYRMDALFGVLGGRPESRRRAAIYRLLAGALADFRWSVEDGVQNAHPSRLFRFPTALREDREDPRPRVLQLIPNMEYGGAQRLVETLVAGSLSERYRFEVLCQTHVGEIGEELLRKGVPVHVAGMSGWRRLSEWKRFADYAALLEPDLVHSHLIPADIGAHISFGGRVPRLSLKHNVDPEFTRVVKLVERHVLRGVPVFAVSDAVALAKSHLCSWGMRPPVLQSPPSVPVASSPAPFFRTGEPVRLLAIGRLHPQKRLDIYLRAAAELERRFPGRFSFRVVGEGRESEPLRALAAELGIRDRIDFRPAVADVAGALDDADIVVMVSDYEGYPLVVLEMLARGRIPLIRRVPGTDGALPGALERCYVDSASPVDVAEKVLEICAEPDHFVELSREGLAWVTGRSDYASVTGGIYDELLRSAAPRARTRVLHLITRLIVGGAQENTIASVERVDPA